MNLVVEPEPDLERPRARRRPLADDPAGLAALVAALQGVPGAAAVVDPMSMPPEAGFIAADGRTVLVPVALEADADADLPESAGRLGEFVAAVPLADGATADVTGEWPVWADFNATNEEALHKAELLSGVPTVLLLLVAFGSVVAAGIRDGRACAGRAGSDGPARRPQLVPASVARQGAAEGELHPLMIGSGAVATGASEIYPRGYVSHGDVQEVQPTRMGGLRCPRRAGARPRAAVRSVPVWAEDCVDDGGGLTQALVVAQLNGASATMLG